MVGLALVEEDMVQKLKQNTGPSVAVDWGVFQRHRTCGAGPLFQIAQSCRRSHSSALLLAIIADSCS
jgi:hypothetical protein